MGRDVVGVAVGFESHSLSSPSCHCSGSIEGDRRCNPEKYRRDSDPTELPLLYGRELELAEWKLN